METIRSDQEEQQPAEFHLPGYSVPALQADAIAEPLKMLGAQPDGNPIICATTRRIVLISPYPNRLHEVIRDLSAACYDVMVFHRVDEYVLHSLPADLYLVDGAPAISWERILASGRLLLTRPSMSGRFC